MDKVGHSIGNGQIYRALKRHNWRKVMPRSRHPKKASEEAINASKNNRRVAELKSDHSSKKIHVFFQDEAGFGRINKPKYCWCTEAIRPSVPFHHIESIDMFMGRLSPLRENIFS